MKVVVFFTSPTYTFGPKPGLLLYEKTCKRLSFKLIWRNSGKNLPSTFTDN